jgi:benzoyl-CoA reductase subunit B
MAAKAPDWTRELADGGKALLGMVEAAPSDENQVIAAGLRCVTGNRERLVTAVEEGRRLIWAHLLMTPEIFSAMGIETFSGDGYAPAMAGARPQGTAGSIDAAENAGLPTDTCSMIKAIVGTILAGQMPMPELFVTQSHPCDGIVAGIQMVHTLLGVPTFCLDAPVWRDDRGIDYYAQQLKEMVAFLEEHTGQRLDQDRLREVVEESNRAMELRLAVNELKRAVPCPLSNLLYGLAYQVYAGSAGSPEATDFFGQLLHHVEEQAKAGKGAVPVEKIRLVWGGVPLVYGDVGGIGGWMERQCGAVTVRTLWGYEGYHHIDTATYDSMMRGIAQKLLDQVMTREFHGVFDYYVDDFLRAYEEFKADCLIFPGGIGCKGVQATIGLLKDVCREKGIPMLALGVDLWDERVTPADAIKAQIEDFFATTVLA